MSMIFPEGRLSIELKLKHGAVREVSIESSRRVDACRVLQGRSVQEALSMIPMLYSVCGKAQIVTGAAACRQAMGAPVTNPARRTWGLLVHVEMALEHLWCFHLDWPRILGIKSDPDAYFQLRKQLESGLMPVTGNPGLEEMPDELPEECADTLERHLREQVFGTDVLSGSSQWEFLPAGAGSLLSEMMLRLSENDEPWDGCRMPMPQAAEIARRLASEEDFARHPAWGEPRETGAQTRMNSHAMIRKMKAGILSRFAARMLELAALPEKIRGSGKSDGEVSSHALELGIGVAWVETSRGMLLHRVEVEKDTVRRYQILAPTEWNFHPRGALFQGLTGLPARDERLLRSKAEMMVMALDPCIGYELRIKKQ
ncbi:MAG: nickel-dependent hydrogenase large subunit [Burkholderiales bacterium]